MVLVAPAWRHRGLASRLMERTIRRLQGLGVTPVLDATPAGEAVYRQLGFRAGFALERWQGGVAGATAIAPAGADGIAGNATEGRAAAAVASKDRTAAPRAAGLADLDTLATLDRAANGLDRRTLLEAFLRRPATRAWVAADRSGFAIARSGTRATQIGPLVAHDPASAQVLLDTALRHVRGPFFLDVPSRWRAFAVALEGRGCTRQRPFVRMDLGAPQAVACDERLFVLAGPEFG